jgi:hydroxymethylglutaryl-CoA lyase
MIKIIECPRDAMQGMTEFISTELKIRYINQLLKVGFDTIDFGSFVSPKAVPQMKDTKEVFDGLALDHSTSKLLAIVANKRGGEEATQLKGINYLGFPLSISETFQKRNTNESITEALNTLNELLNLCTKSKKELIVYLSMGFGNPYNDPYDSEMVVKFSGILKSIGVNIISIADTIGVASSDQIATLLTILMKEFNSDTEFGVHLHSNPSSSKEKIMAAYKSGCRRFDGALLGFGGCPFADDKLVGNIDTLTILEALASNNETSSINIDELNKAKLIASEIFS